MDSKEEKSKENIANSDRKRPAQEPLQQTNGPKRQQREATTATTAAEPVATKEKEANSKSSPRINSPEKTIVDVAATTKAASAAAKDDSSAKDTNMAKKEVAVQSPANTVAVEKAPEHTVADVKDNRKTPPAENSATDKKATPPPPPTNAEPTDKADKNATEATAVVETTNQKVTAAKPAVGSNPPLPGMAFPPQQHHGGGGLMPIHLPHLPGGGVAGFGQQVAPPPPPGVYFARPPMNLHPSFFLNQPTYFLPQQQQQQQLQQLGLTPMFVNGVPPNFPLAPRTAFAAHTQAIGGGGVPPPFNLPPPSSAHSLQTTRQLALQAMFGSPTAAVAPAASGGKATSANAVATKAVGSEEMPYSPLSKALSAMNPRKSMATLLARQKGEQVPWYNTPVDPFCARRVQQEAHDLEALLAVKANNNTNTAAQLLETLFNRPALNPIRDKLIERWILANEEIAINRTIVNRLRAFISHHHLTGKRPDTVQNALDAIGVAAVFEYNNDKEAAAQPVIVSAVAKRLGMGRQKLASCHERAQKILKGTKDGENKVLFEPTEKKIRHDRVRDLAAKVVYDWSHSDESGTKIVKKGRRPVKVTNPHTEQEERHFCRVWLEDATWEVRYQAFLKSKDYAKFKQEHPDKKFGKSIFTLCVCKCIRDARKPRPCETDAAAL